MSPSLLLPVTGVLLSFSTAAPSPDSLRLPGPVVRTSAHTVAAASAAGLGLTPLIRAESSVAAEVRRGSFPGAALAIGRRDQIVVEQGIGRTGETLGDPEVDPDRTVYDLASLTKVVATTTAVMLLVEDARMELDAPVSRYLPRFSGGLKDRVTIRQLLTHTAGLPAGARASAATPEGALDRVLATPLVRFPGDRVEYSDVGFVVLWAAAEQAAGEPLFRLLDRRVYGPLKMRFTTFQAGDGCVSCAATSRARADAFQGTVHDPIARRLGGITGNAGLFSTVHDLARFSAMLANGGELEGVRVLREETIREFTRRQPGAGTRALGWDTPRANGSGAGGDRISPRAFGHTGFTGTSIWIDPDRGTWTVLLANRTYSNTGSGRIQALRRRLNAWVTEAADGSGSRLAGSD